MADEFDQALAAAQLRAKTLTTESIIDGLIEERNAARKSAEVMEAMLLELGVEPWRVEDLLPWKKK